MSYCRVAVGLVLALLTGLSVAPSWADTAAAQPKDEWTRFRGPNGSGLSDTAFNNPITEKDFAWKIALPGKGHSSPVVWGDHLYITSGDPETAARIVLCLNAQNGSTIWKREYNSRTYRQLHADNSYASATPAVDEAGVYLSWSTPESLSLTALTHDGKDLWTRDLGPFGSQHGSGASPMTVDGLVILTNDQEGPKSTVEAFDHFTGHPRWKIDRKPGDKTSLATPCLFRPKAGGPAQLILSNKSTGITSVDPHTGKVNWEVPTACPDRTVGSPVVAGDVVVAGSGEGGATRNLTAVRPSATPDGKPEVAYKLAKFPPYVPTPVAKGDLLYLWADSGVVTCVKAATGEQVWSGRADGSYYGSPVCAGDTLWAINRKGELVGVAASADQFKLIGKLNLGEPSQATPAIAGGRMYLRTVSHLICVK